MSTKHRSSFDASIQDRCHMESALILDTDPSEIVTAHELRSWSEAGVASTQFQCTHCTAGLTPAAFRPHHVVQPYFRTPPGVEHDSDCPLVRQSPDPSAQQKQPSDDSNADVSRRLSGYPIRLIEPAEERVASVTAEIRSSVPGPQLSAQSSRSRQYVSARRPRTSRTLRTFADAHWRMSKDDRHQAPIDLPGIDAANYHYAFKKLRFDEVERLAYARVYYADVRYTAELRKTSNTFELEFFAGEYDPEKKRHTRPWKLVIDHGSWSDLQRNDFEDEFDSAVQEARRTKFSPRCYALGQQDKASLELLRVKKRHLVTVLTHRPEH